MRRTTDEYLEKMSITELGELQEKRDKEQSAAIASIRERDNELRTIRMLIYTQEASD